MTEIKTYYRNNSGGPLERPNDINWPRYDIGGLEAQDVDNLLIDGAVIDLEKYNNINMFLNGELKSLIESGQIVRVIDNKDVDPLDPFIPDFAQRRVERNNFDNVDSFTVSYSSFLYQPLAEIFVYEQGEEQKSFPEITYDSINKRLTANFQGHYVSGYIILR